MIKEDINIIGSCPLVAMGFKVHSILCIFHVTHDERKYYRFMPVRSYGFQNPLYPMYFQLTHDETNVLCAPWFLFENSQPKHFVWSNVLQEQPPVHFSKHLVRSQWLKFYHQRLSCLDYSWYMIFLNCKSFWSTFKFNKYCNVENTLDYKGALVSCRSSWDFYLWPPS
jgi:hypothetical protein